MRRTAGWLTAPRRSSTQLGTGCRCTPLKSWEEHLPAALSAFGSAEPPRLTAVVPPNVPLGMDKEFMLTSFHRRECLRRVSLTIGGKRRQVAFCPYCGVTNDNAETGLNHVRKHLDIMLVCGGCHTKSVCLGQALQKHMKDNCPAVVAILGKTRGGKKLSRGPL